MKMDDLYGNQLFFGHTLLQLIIGTAVILSAFYLVMYYVRNRDRDLPRGSRILASALNTLTIGLGLTCFMFALSTIGYELTTTIDHPPLEALRSFGNLIVLQIASIFISFSGYWYSLRYRSRMRELVRAPYRSVCRKLGLSRIGAVHRWVPFRTPLEQ
jgi:multisubunit Na+/H+ antiporter MnhC subunit